MGRFPLLLRGVIFVLCCLCLPFLFHEGTDGFRLGVLYSARLGVGPSEELLSLSLQQTLSEPFYYLSSGTQSYVFESQGGEVVLKLFRRRKSDPERILQAAEIAYLQAREETALLFLHFNQSAPSLPSVTLYDRLKRPYTIALDRFAFAIQKKGKSFRKELMEKLAANRAEPLIASYLRLVQQRAAKGICNRDVSAIKNFGVVGDLAVEIDFGSYYIDPEEARGELARFEQRIRSFFRKYAPESLPVFEEVAERVRAENRSPSFP